MSDKKLSALNAKLAVLEAVLEPALTLARALDLSLDDLQKMVATSYYRQYRTRGLSQQATARRLGKSIRTIYGLAKESSEGRHVLEESQRLSWQREIVRIVGSGVEQEAELFRKMRFIKKRDLDETLANLIEQGIIIKEAERLLIAPIEVSMMAEDWDHRIQSLRHFLNAVGQVVYQRFFRLRPGPGFARVLSFQGARDAVEELGSAQYAAMKSAVVQTDEEAKNAPERRQLSLAFCVVERPSDPVWREPGS